MKTPGDLFAEVACAAELAQLLKRFARVEGWLNPADGYLLYRLARDAAGRGAIVEIGSWMGLSTAWLAAGSKDAGREPVHAVDVFDGGPMLKEQAIIKNEGTTYHRFAENLESLGLFDQVKPVVAESATAARQWQHGAIRLLFIDGDHRYPAVKEDFDLWTAHMAVGGLVVLDDAIDHYPGVLRLCGEIRADAAHWQHRYRGMATETFLKIA